jgi:hypothetical protein
VLPLKAQCTSREEIVLTDEHICMLKSVSLSSARLTQLNAKKLLKMLLNPLRGSR